MKKEYADYLLKKTREDYDKIAKDFSDSRYSIWEEFNIFKDYIKDGDRILDLGCGNGRLLDLFRDKNVEYTGIDNSEELIQIAKEKSKILPRTETKFLVRGQNPRLPSASPRANGGQAKSKIQFLVADALNLPFPDNYFDKVFSIAVLHHISSEEYRLRFLEEAKRVLKPGGFLILTVWYLWEKPKTLKLLLKYGLLKITGLSKLDFKDIFVPWQNKILRYVHCFTKKELENLAKRAGFKIERIGIFRRRETLNYNIYLMAGK